MIIAVSLPLLNLMPMMAIAYTMTAIHTVDVFQISLLFALRLCHFETSTKNKDQNITLIMKKYERHYNVKMSMQQSFQSLN